MSGQGLGLPLLALAVAACSAPVDTSAAPQGTPRVLAVDQVAGFYALRPATGTGHCSVSLSNLAGPGGYGVLIEACDIAAVAGARAWRPTVGGFEMTGADGAILMAFRRMGEDTFEATTGGWRLSRAAMR